MKDPKHEEVEIARRFLMTANVAIAWQQTAAWFLTAAFLIFTFIPIATAWTMIAFWQAMFWFMMAVLFWTNYFQLKIRRSLSRTIVELAEADPIK